MTSWHPAPSSSLLCPVKTLIATAQMTGRTCIISGPFSSPRFGDGKFSRIRQLHIFLKGFCFQSGIPYIDNFYTFWNWSNLFAMDGLHLSLPGAHLLSMSMDLALKSCGQRRAEVA